jgi:eukaryotic-like serine/threonine-protein kinase
MITVGRPNLDALPLVHARQIDDLCCRFEAQWREAGDPERRPRIEAFLDSVPELARSALLGELVSVEIELRQLEGEHPGPDEYAGRFPMLPPQSIGVGGGPAHSTRTGQSHQPNIPGYQILEELGRGGMAVVHKARHTQLRRVVALKMIIAGEHAGPEALERFRVEAEVIARLQHPHIIQIHEIGAGNGFSFISLEFCPGGSLDKKLKDKPLPPRQASEMVEKLARAMSAVHEKGILHRDLKPANVLLGEDGEPRITDFGLAKNTDPGADRQGAGSNLTHTNTIIGTPSYMAPEQALGASKLVGPAADVYSLGAILYDCLTGRPPFQGASILETLDQVRTLSPVSPRHLNPNITGDLDTICLKCLRKEPVKRYASAGELADDVRRFLDGKPIQARPVSLLERSWKWVKRHPAETGLLAAVALLLTALTVGTLIKNAELSKALTRSDEALKASDEANNQAKARLWESLRDRSRAMRMSRAPGQRVDSLRSIREARELPTPSGHSLAELQTEAIAALALPDIESLRTWDGYPAGTVNLEFDGELARYARLASDGAVSVRRVDDDALIAQWREPTDGAWRNVDPLRFSPDGRFLSVAHPGTGHLTVRRIADDGSSIIHVDTGCFTSRPVDFSPDSERLAYVTDGRIAIATLNSREVRYLRATGSEEERDIRFAPDGRRFALNVRRAGQWYIEVRDVDTGDRQQVLSDSHGPNAPAWHPNGQILAAGGNDGFIRIWDVGSGELLRKLVGHRRTDGISCIFDSSGSRLLSNDWFSVLRVWEPSSGKQLLSFAAHNYNFLRISPSHCIPTLAAANSTKLQLLRLHAGLEYRTIDGGLATDGQRMGLGGDRSYAAHPDGRLVAAVDHERNSVVIVDLAAGRCIARLRSGLSVPLCWEDGRSLLTCGKTGLLRWPLRADPDKPGHYQLGPPACLLNYGVYASYGISADTRTIAVPVFDNGAMLFHRGPPLESRPLQPQQDVRDCSVSPDGKFAASGSHDNTDGFGAKVWDAATGKLVTELPVPGLCHVAFSADSRWLLTTGGGCRLWNVGFRDGPHYVGGAVGCFSPDSGILAVDDSAGAIRLVSTAIGNTLVRLEAPEQANLMPRGFTPDGARLLAVDADTLDLHVWDLRAVRQGLLELGLETGLPEYPPVKEMASPPIRVDVEPVGNGSQR